MSRHAKNLEALGVPTAPCCGENVSKYVTGWDRLYDSGIALRYITFPLPTAGVPRSVHEKYISGNDPVTGLPIMQEIISALTKPLTLEEQETGLPTGAIEPRLLNPDTEENLQALFKQKDWTDYLPVVLPTEEKVGSMLKGTSHKPGEVIKTVNWPGGARQATVEKVAVAAVMAGAKPEYLPVILAAASTASFANSTTSMANMLVVNGPVRREIGMNSGMGAMGPNNEPNAVIGRAFTILSKTIGNLHSGTTNFASLGSNLQYNNCCFAENEEGLPDGWEPLSVKLGFKRTDSVVTVFTGWSYISCCGEALATYPPHFLIRDYMKALSAIGSGALLCADPLIAHYLHDQQGFATKESLAKWLAENVKIPASQYWGNGVVTTFNWNFGLQGLEPFATWQKALPETLIAPYTNPRAINTVVVGGRSNTLWFVTDFRAGPGVSVDAWR